MLASLCNNYCSKEFCRLAKRLGPLSLHSRGRRCCYILAKLSVLLCASQTSIIQTNVACLLYSKLAWYHAHRVFVRCFGCSFLTSLPAGNCTSFAHASETCVQTNWTLVCVQPCETFVKHAIEQTHSWRICRVDGAGRLKFDSHTGQTARMVIG